MQSLTLEELYLFVVKARKKYGEKSKEILVFLGDDEELNGVHEAFFTQAVSPEEASQFCVDNEEFGQNTSILIS